MNNQQRESAAKYAYDLSKAFAIAALITATADGVDEQVLQLVAASVGLYLVGWRIES